MFKIASLFRLAPALTATLWAFGIHTAAFPAKTSAQFRTQDGLLDDRLYQTPAKGGVRRWQIAPGRDTPVHDARTANAGVVRLLPPGTIVANAGCQADDDQRWCKVRLLASRTTGFVQAEFLEPARGPDGIVPLGPDDSEHRARKRRFDVTGNIHCAQERGQTMGPCRVGIARGVGGDATAVATFPNGFARRLRFVHGRFISANATMSGSGTDTDWRVENGRHLIRVDDQRYDILDALLFGK